MRMTLAPTVAVLLAVGATCVHAQETLLLRYQPHEQVYRATVRAEQLDEFGDLLEEEDQSLAVRVAFRPAGGGDGRDATARADASTADGQAAVAGELVFTVEGAGEPATFRYPADALGRHIPHEWLPEQWAIPVLGALRLPEGAVAVGSSWQERFRLLLTTSELEGAGRLDYRLAALDGGRATISFRGRGNGVRRVEGGEVGTGRPVFLSADTSRRGQAVFDLERGRLLRLEQTLELRVSAEPLDARTTADAEETFLQRVRITAVLEAVEGAAPR